MNEARLLIERLLPGPYLELYGRKQVEGWCAILQFTDGATRDAFSQRAIALWAKAALLWL